VFGLGDLSPYRIEHHGQVFYGNVSLRDFHVFEYDDALFLVNVESMAVYPISKEVENLLNRIAALSDRLLERWADPSLNMTISLIILAYSWRKNAICAVFIATEVTGNMG
jgi:hypothetical protein